MSQWVDSKCLYIFMTYCKAQSLGLDEDLHVFVDKTDLWSTIQWLSPTLEVGGAYCMSCKNCQEYVAQPKNLQTVVSKLCGCECIKTKHFYHGDVFFFF